MSYCFLPKYMTQFLKLVQRHCPFKVEIFTLHFDKFIGDTAYQILSESAKLCRTCDEIIVVCFLVHSVEKVLLSSMLLFVQVLATFLSLKVKEVDQSEDGKRCKKMSRQERLQRFSKRERKVSRVKFLSFKFAVCIGLCKTEEITRLLSST